MQAIACGTARAGTSACMARPHTLLSSRTHRGPRLHAPSAASLSPSATQPSARRGFPCCSSSSSSPGRSSVLERQGVPAKRGVSSPIYKVLLHNDDHNKREYVVKVLMRVLEGMNMDDAVQLMMEAHETGVALVKAGPQEEAEACCEQLRINGLCSTIEPGC